MVNEQAREELEKLRELNMRIDALIDEKRKLAARVTSLARPLSEPVSGTRQSDIANAAAKLVDMGREIDRTIDDYYERKDRILEKINALSDVRYRLLLSWYYVHTERLTLEDVADKMGYHHQSLRRLHVLALDAYQKKHFS